MIMEREKGPVYRFLTTYGNNVTKLIAANFAFMVFNIPSMLIGFAMTLYFLPRINSLFVPENFYAYMTEAGFKVSAEAGNTDALAQVYYLIILFCVMTCRFLPCCNRTGSDRFCPALQKSFQRRYDVLEG